MSNIKILKHNSNSLKFQVLDRIYTITADVSEKDIPIVSFSTQFVDNDRIEIFRIDKNLEIK